MEVADGLFEGEGDDDVDGVDDGEDDALGEEEVDGVDVAVAVGEAVGEVLAGGNENS